MAVAILGSCGGGDSDESSPTPTPTPTPTPVVPGAPTITVAPDEVNVFGGAKVEQKDSTLLIGGEKVAWWTSPRSKVTNVHLTFNGKAFFFDNLLSEEWTLTLFVENEAGKSASRDITVSADGIYGIADIGPLQVDQPKDLLAGLTFAPGIELQKVEIEQDGQRTEIADPHSYTPEYPGECSFIFTVKVKDDNTTEVRADNVTIKPLEYKAMEITNINPETLMPKVEVWDKDVYKHIEHLRIPESTVITDMMWKYGAGNYSPEEYQQLMKRLNTGMLWENPVDYDNYEAVWWTPSNAPSNHAHAEWFTLNTLVKHANFKVINPSSSSAEEILYNLCKQDPNKINIIWVSVDADVDKEQYDARNIEEVKEYDKEKNLLVFCAWWNIRTEGGNLHNKIYQEDIPLPDEHSVYSSASRAHGKNDNTLDRHLLITFGTNEDGDIDQTNEEAESSKFPVWFHDKVLFSGHAFSHRNYATDKIRASTWKYATSHTNFVNVAIADLCFQMKADVSDVDELLEMIRSTALTDHIRFDLNGDGDTNDTYEGQPETQPLQLMNPAGFFKKYLMPLSMPASISWSKTTTLDKGFYHAVVFNIPGVEVKINGEWIALDGKNQTAIMAQNPLTLEWRLNGSLLRKLGYKQGDTITGQLIVADDKWNGLNITKDISIQLTQ